ncbi:MAG: hypothetical protein Q8J99_00620 [Sulfuritalea sp.]|nr:hypothetical protein [Sulfuritalea sp.]
MFEANSTKAIICDDAERELTGLDESWRKRLWTLVYSAFKQWKDEHGNRHPQRLTGMFAPMKLSDLLPAENTIPFAEAEPWQCAGFLAPCPTKLAIKLWEDDYPPFSELTSAVGMRFILAMLICRFKDSQQDCLFEAHSYMNQMVAMESIGIKLLDEHRLAIEAHKTRTPGGKISGAKQTKEKDGRKQLIKDTEAKLPDGTKPHHINKVIAKAVGVLPDTVGRLRREIKKEAGGS